MSDAAQELAERNAETLDLIRKSHRALQTGIAVMSATVDLLREIVRDVPPEDPLAPDAATIEIRITCGQLRRIRALLADVDDLKPTGTL